MILAAHLYRGQDSVFIAGDVSDVGSVELDDRVEFSHISMVMALEASAWRAHLHGSNEKIAAAIAAAICRNRKPSATAS